MDIEEGDIVPLPCRNCSSVSIEITVRTGTHSVICAKCGLTTLVAVERGKSDWLIRTMAPATQP